jgi:hypothetical protein
MKKILIYTIVLILIFLPICSATHDIFGIVKNASDGTGANTHTILLWNPLVGINDNLSDIIGPSGNSGLDNNYKIDCELLDTPCTLGDILTLKVINNGDDYVSEEKNVTVTSSTNDSVENITLNSIPEVNLISPINFENISNSQVNFNCSSLDLDGNLDSIGLYGNWTGAWHLNETKTISGTTNFTIFTKTILEGFYIYGCKIIDSLSIFSFSSQNNSFNLDLTKPIINSVNTNISSSCGISESIRINCTTYDEFLKIDEVIIQATSPSSIKNYSAYFLTGDIYYSDIQLNETGSWNFNCFSKDSAGNVNSLNSIDIMVYSSLPDLFVNFSKINLSKSNPIENESVKINAFIENLGCTDAENILVGFFEGDPSNSGTNIENSTINITQLSSIWTNVSWNVKIGPNNLFIIADYNSLINEDDETNNKANKTISINSWQDIYGNTTVDKIIGNGTDKIKKWFNESNLGGNIFVTDSESSINWLSLQAIGEIKEGGESTDDFLEIDYLLGMNFFEDSVSKLFSDNQNPKEIKDIIVHQKEIQNIPIINSTNNSNFITGILWDYSDDTNGTGGEFDLADKEDIVFLANINKESEGTYGFYDYQIKIPSKLREYQNLDSEEIYLYYDLN